MPQHMIISDQPPGSTPRGAVGCRVGFARTAEQADTMVRQLRGMGCRDVQCVEIGAGEHRNGADDGVRRE